MASLLDRIESIGAEAAQPKQRGIEDILRQKSGKALAKKGPAASTLGEQQAISAGKQAIKEQTFAERLSGVQARGKEELLAEQQRLQQAQLKQQATSQQQKMQAEANLLRQGLQSDQETSRIKRESGLKTDTKSMNNKAESALRDLASQRGISLDNMFSQYKWDAAELEDRRDSSQLEQQAFLLAMQDKKYLDNLQMIGEERQLQNDINFDNELNSIIFGNSLDNLLSDMNFKVGQNVKGREFQEQLSKIDIDMAVNIAKASLNDSLERSKWEAIGTTVGTVADYYGSND